METVLKNLFPELNIFNSAYLNVTEQHTLYYEECGNPKGYPVIFLHGGPGSGCNAAQRRFFDPEFYRIVLFDQRGCGRSMPAGCIENNTTQDLIEDIEALRKHLNISRWMVFGGSWGSTLALVYAIHHPQSISGLILRGIFLSRPDELKWFMHDAQHFFPEAWAKWANYLEADKRQNILQSYAELVFDADPDIAGPAAVAWNHYESSIMTLMPRESGASTTPVEVEIARARVQIHYIQNHCFIDGDAVLKSCKQLSNIPMTIIQGRYDMVCPPKTAWELFHQTPHAHLEIIADAGHSAMEPGVTSALVNATENFKYSVNR